MDILSVRGVSKSFGTHKVIDDISLDVPQGCAFGFIGANGAGKTTTMKMILGLLPMDSGEIFVCGEKVSFGANKTNRHIGYLPDVPEFYGYMRPAEYLWLCGEIAGLTSAENKRRGAALLETVGLAGADKKIRTFSRGMKQRLGMAQALLNEPRLLICDEPTSALDPIGRREVLDILRQIKNQTTVIFSTHILSDVESVCDRVAVLNGGHIALCGTLAKLRESHKRDSVRIEFVSVADRERFTKAAAALTKNAETADAQIIVHAADIADAQREILRVLSANDILPLKLELLEPTVESLFLEVAQ